jgi:hypothetical protein
MQKNCHLILVPGSKFSLVNCAVHLEKDEKLFGVISNRLSLHLGSGIHSLVGSLLSFQVADMFVAFSHLIF